VACPNARFWGGEVVGKFGRAPTFKRPVCEDAADRRQVASTIVCTRPSKLTRGVQPSVRRAFGQEQIDLGGAVEFRIDDLDRVRFPGADHVVVRLVLLIQ
jgi:hypothetical protein